MTNIDRWQLSVTKSGNAVYISINNIRFVKRFRASHIMSTIIYKNNSSFFRIFNAHAQTFKLLYRKFDSAPPCCQTSYDVIMLIIKCVWWRLFCFVTDVNRIVGLDLWDFIVFYSHYSLCQLDFFSTDDVSLLTFLLITCKYFPECKIFKLQYYHVKKKNGEPGKIS